MDILWVLFSCACIQRVWESWWAFGTPSEISLNIFNTVLVVLVSERWTYPATSNYLVRISVWYQPSVLTAMVGSLSYETVRYHEIGRLPLLTGWNLNMQSEMTNTSSTPLKTQHDNKESPFWIWRYIFKSLGFPCFFDWVLPECKSSFWSWKYIIRCSSIAPRSCWADTPTHQGPCLKMKDFSIFPFSWIDGWYTRWWFQRLFYVRPFFRKMISNDKHIFQVDWNHQPAKKCQFSLGPVVLVDL